MPRSASSSVENSFIRGLVTETTNLNFPENGCTETFNCVFERTGNVKRRLGFDYEDGYVLNSIGSSIADKAFTYFYWKTVGGDGSLSFLVVQIGDILHFFEASSSTALSANKKSFTFDISEFAVAGAPDTSGIECSFSYGNGSLFVSHHYIEPFFITYDADSDDISAEVITVQIRDFDGVEDGLDIDERPSTLSTEHKYNLYNQGWYSDRVDVSGGGSENPVDYWDSKRSDFPSSAEVWWLFKDSDGELNTGQVNEFALGNSPVPKGHYILDALFQDRSDVSGITGLSVVTAGTARPSSIAFFNSRVFYAGVNAKGFEGKVYFSPIIENANDYGKCYQSADPTAEHISDLLKTDGGTVAIPEMGDVILMFSILSSLLIFANNGIWVISGSDGAGFTASDYTVKKLSSIPSVSSASFVDVDGLPVWWNSDGIYAVTPDQTTGQLNVQSLTDQTLKSFFLEIPSGNFPYVRGAYNPQTKIIQWLYRSTEGDTVADNYEFDRVLCLNRLTGAFYPWTISEPASGPVVSGIAVTEGFGVSEASSDVVTSTGDLVVDGSAVQVVITNQSQESLTGTFRYITIYNDSGTYKITFAQEIDSSYVDWLTFDGSGTDFDSYVISGYRNHGNALTKFQNPYIIVHSKIESGSSCFLQGLWEFTTSGNTGRWTTPQEVYLTHSNRSYTSRKIKLRGKGLALQLKFFSASGAPFNLSGWATFETIAQLP